MTVRQMLRQWWHQTWQGLRGRPRYIWHDETPGCDGEEWLCLMLLVSLLGLSACSVPLAPSAVAPAVSPAPALQPDTRQIVPGHLTASDADEPTLPPNMTPTPTPVPAQTGTPQMPPLPVPSNTPPIAVPPPVPPLPPPPPPVPACGTSAATFDNWADMSGMPVIATVLLSNAGPFELRLIADGTVTDTLLVTSTCGAQIRRSVFAPSLLHNSRERWWVEVWSNGGLLLTGPVFVNPYN